MYGRIDEGIRLERKKMEFLRRKADYIIDTSHLLTRELRQEIDKIFVDNEEFKNMEEPPAKPDNEKDDTNLVPSERPDNTIKPNEMNKSSLTSTYYIVFIVECLVISGLIIYLIMSNFNSKTIKETFINKLNGLSLNSMKEYNSVELGNNFELGTKYSESMNMYFQDENGKNRPFYMGCYGIGLGRILATLIENNTIIKNNQIKGFSIPYNVAPYKVHIIYNEENRNNAFKLYNNLLNNNIECIIDDRENLTLGNRINDVALLGTPKMIVLGSKFDNENYEIENIKDGKKELVKINNIIEYFK